MQKEKEVGPYLITHVGQGSQVQQLFIAHAVVKIWGRATTTLIRGGQTATFVVLRKGNHSRRGSRGEVMSHFF